MNKEIAEKDKFHLHLRANLGNESDFGRS